METRIDLKTFRCVRSSIMLSISSALTLFCITVSSCLRSRLGPGRRSSQLTWASSGWSARWLNTSSSTASSLVPFFQRFSPIYWD